MTNNFFGLQVKGLDIVVGGHTNTFLWSGPMEDAKVGGVPAGFNFTNVLRAAFTRKNHKISKMTVKSSVSF